MHDVATPELPDEASIDWHPMTQSWWDDIWASPMAPEFDESDVHGLYLLATLVDAFWVEPSQALAAEIRLQRQCFGLTPIDRRRLQWEIDRGEEAERQTAKRRNASAPVSSGNELEPPAKSASKAQWVEYAVALGTSRSAAVRLKKTDLVDRFAEADSDPRSILSG